MGTLSTLIEEYIKEKNRSPNEYLTSASKRAKKIQFATHVAKFTNSDTKSTNILIKKIEQIPYVCTAGSSNVDATRNAAALDVAKLLLLSNGETTLRDEISRGESSQLKPFAENDDQLKEWMEGFSKALEERKPASHTLSKQIYFPVNDDYHLISPLYPSSLAKELYDKVKHDLFSDETKEARNCKKKNLPSEHTITSYPGLCIQKHGGTNPRNISMLNSSAGGTAYLYKSLPPEWKSIQKPPQKQNDFWYEFIGRCFHVLIDLVNYLKSVENKDSNLEIRELIKGHIENAVDTLICYATEVQRFKPGWSNHSKISLSEKFWLDPNNEELKKQREQDDWMNDIANQFARKIVAFLEKKGIKKVDDHEHDRLKKECLSALKEVER